MRLKKHYANLLVSSGTNDAPYLLARFEKMLEIAWEEGCEFANPALRSNPIAVQKSRHDEVITLDEWQDVKEYVFRILALALDDVAPAGYSFGEHRMRPLEYGFWPFGMTTNLYLDT